MEYKNNILETIGNTPLVRLNKVTAEVPALVLMKVETFNPGHSIKDRMAVKMLADAEQRGDIKAGGTIIEVLNPMTNRTVYVKVIGKIPDTAYRDEVAVILSPLAAKLLGAIDPRFFVKVKYHR